MVIASITGLLGDKSSGQLGNIGDQAVDRVGASKDLVSGTNNQTKTNKRQTKTNHFWKKPWRLLASRKQMI